MAVQSGLLDGLARPAIAAFRRGLRRAIDAEAPGCVHQMQTEGTLDAAGQQALSAVLTRYAGTVAAAHATPPGAPA